MAEPVWEEIDLESARDHARAVVDGAPADERIVARYVRDNASVVLVRADARGAWGLIYVCTTSGPRADYSSTLLDLAAEHTFHVGSAAPQYGQGPRVHFAAIRSAGITTARSRQAGEPWRILTADDSGWILDARVTEDFHDAPAYEFEAPGMTWHPIA
ncbi:hypothetical protein [Cellulosimicrobium cellulans]|uniref:Uncharacterized protein n=1 Tax=Cellulosimicrobium cellulans TaxID=1710 RepID=A0A4Y4E0S7_CELCE|nr:hypothetical protein [Cellulosimicrobium cellulans]GED11299.1 hypothetical protein CCE02nite_32980 [Cellulosimicrobium cellulans]